MKREPVHPQCNGCHQVMLSLDHPVHEVCRLFPNPGWIWSERYCTEKTRHGHFVPTWFRIGDHYAKQ